MTGEAVIPWIMSYKVSVRTALLTQPMVGSVAYRVIVYTPGKGNVCVTGDPVPGPPIPKVHLRVLPGGVVAMNFIPTGGGQGSIGT